MAVVIGLLRGVNVGGHCKISMQELRSICVSLGLRDPQTYIQSGNVVFGATTRDVAKLARLLRAYERATGSVIMPTRKAGSSRAPKCARRSHGCFGCSRPGDGRARPGVARGSWSAEDSPGLEPNGRSSFISRKSPVFVFFHPHRWNQRQGFDRGRNLSDPCGERCAGRPLHLSSPRLRDRARSDLGPRRPASRS